MSATTSLFDTIEWIYKLSDNGINNFWYSELPPEYQNIKYLKRAAYSGLIEPIDSKNNVKKWKINMKNVNKRSRIRK